MTTAKIQELKNQIAALRELDIEEIVNEYLLVNNIVPEQASINEILIKDIPYYYKRIIDQLENEMENSDFSFYPEKSDYGNEYGNGTLTSDNSGMYEAFLRNDINSGVRFLKRLVWYQIFNGFWDRSVRKFHDPDSVEIEKLKSETNEINKISKKKFKEIQQKLSELDETKLELTNFKNEKTNQLQIISNNVPIAQNAIQEINNLVNQSTQLSEQINSQLDLSKQKLSEIENQKNEKNTKFDDLLIKLNFENKNFKEKYTQFSSDIDEYNLKMEEGATKLNNLFIEFDEMNKVFDERSEYLDELIGREVGASLFETFKQRKNELSKPVFIWRSFVYATGILTIGFIFLLFYINPITNISTDEIWQRILINSIKTIPAIFLLYFTIKQYNKERNFQETYAFKSAVALTINAYKEQISNPEKQNDMIIESVKNIFRPPTINQTKDEEKDINSLLDIIKNLASTGKEVADKVLKK
jgi:hypothetical protein